MRILGIETSCDDTAIGIVNYQRGKFEIEVQITASQALIHRRYGGVVPEVAAREHALTILPTIRAALKQSGLSWPSIDALAVTGGPGLNTALVVGVEAARTLSYAIKKPVVRVNHLEAHIIANWIAPDNRKIEFPAVALVVSGGHTELVLMRGIGRYKLLGRTLDDAVGEAFDKVAKMLGLPYPGGPSISKRATSGDPKAFKFPVALQRSGNLDFSYAGLKTAVLYKLRDLKKRDKQTVNDICASFQAAAATQLVNKTRWAMRRTSAKTLLLAGGVAANESLRQRLAVMIADEFPGAGYFQPPLTLCMDNGVMIAIAACLRLSSGGRGAFQAQKKQFMPWAKLRADPNWELV